MIHTRTGICVARRMTLAITVVVTLLAHRFSTAEPQYTGVELMAGGGINVCLESGNRDCENTMPSFSVLVAAGYRFYPYLGVYLDFTYGQLSPEEGSLATMSLMPTVRGFYPIGDVEIHVGLGLGWSRYDWEGGEQSLSWEHFFNFKLGLGGAYAFLDNWKVGLNMEVILNADEAGEYCVEDYCGDNNNDITDLFAATIFIKGTFGL